MKQKNAFCSIQSLVGASRVRRKSVESILYKEYFGRDACKSIKAAEWAFLSTSISSSYQGQLVQNIGLIIAIILFFGKNILVNFTPKSILV